MSSPRVDLQRPDSPDQPAPGRLPDLAVPAGDPVGVRSSGAGERTSGNQLSLVDRERPHGAVGPASQPLPGGAVPTGDPGNVHITGTAEGSTRDKLSVVDGKRVHVAVQSAAKGLPFLPVPGGDAAGKNVPRNLQVSACNEKLRPGPRAIGVPRGSRVYKAVDALRAVAPQPVGRALRLGPSRRNGQEDPDSKKARCQ